MVFFPICQGCIYATAIIRQFYLLREPYKDQKLERRALNLKEERCFQGLFCHRFSQMFQTSHISPGTAPRGSLQGKDVWVKQTIPIKNCHFRQGFPALPVAIHFKHGNSRQLIGVTF